MTDVKSVSSQLLVQAARDQGFQVRVFSKRLNFFEVSKGSQSFLIQATAMPSNTQMGARIANNKFLTKKILQDHNLPIPRSWSVQKASELRKIVAKYHPFPLVVKPAEGAHGNEVYSDIENDQELNVVVKEIFDRKAPRDILVEEYVTGKDLRIFVVGDTVPAVLERIPAHVIGDGEKTIRQLVKIFNQNPLVGEKFEKPMCKIHITKEVKRILSKQGLTPSSVPAKGETAWLRKTANISTGGIGKDATDSTPESIKRIAVEACAAIGLTIAGLDVIYNEETKRAVILEINDTAGIDIHHYPVIGKSRDVAGAIIKYLFAQPALQTTSQTVRSAQRIPSWANGSLPSFWGKSRLGKKLAFNS
jgi:D-alanine-D-alanine ligase-like ATP-grasp enzyme